VRRVKRKAGMFMEFFSIEMPGCLAANLTGGLTRRAAKNLARETGGYVVKFSRKDVKKEMTSGYNRRYGVVNF
jgi:hypothetical protein